jgi:hypothetical protein
VLAHIANLEVCLISIHKFKMINASVASTLDIPSVVNVDPRIMSGFAPGTKWIFPRLSVLLPD